MFIPVLKKILIIILIVLNLIVFFPYKSLAVESAENQYIWEIAKLLYDFLNNGKVQKFRSCQLLLNGTIIYYDLERDDQFGEYDPIWVNGRQSYCQGEFGGTGCYESACIQNPNEAY